MSHTLAIIVVSGTFVMTLLSMTSAQDGGGAKPQAADAKSPTDEVRRGLKPFEAMIGEWEGTLGAPTAEGQKSQDALPIVWCNAWSFDGRWLRMEFASKESMGVGPRGNHLEFVGLMTFNPGEKRIESIWMNPRIRVRPDHYIDNREMFFEKGSWDAAGKVLTLIASKQNGEDSPTIEVQSTFTIVDADHFICVDAEKDTATGEWKPVTRFELARRK